MVLPEPVPAGYTDGDGSHVSPHTGIGDTRGGDLPTADLVPPCTAGTWRCLRVCYRCTETRPYFDALIAVITAAAKASTASTVASQAAKRLWTAEVDVACR